MRWNHRRLLNPFHCADVNFRSSPLQWQREKRGKQNAHRSAEQRGRLRARALFGGQSRYRQLGVPATLSLHQRHLLRGLHDHVGLRHVRQPHRLRDGRRLCAARGHKHVLLDQLHVHAAWTGRQKGRSGGGVSVDRAGRRRRAPDTQLLSVGAVRRLPTRRPLLPAASDLEAVRKRLDQQHHRRQSGVHVVPFGRSQIAVAGPVRILAGHAAEPRSLGLDVHFLRGAQPGERPGQHLPDRPLPGRRLPRLRHASPPDVQHGSGIAQWPAHRSVPAHDQVQFPQVRPIGQHSEARRPVPALAKHLQREALHLPVVLVDRAGRHQRTNRALPFARHRLAGGSPARAAPTHQNAAVRFGDGRATRGLRRLLHAHVA